MFKNEHFTEKLPKRLFRIVIERLKIEQLLKGLRKRLSIFWVFLIFSAVLGIFAMITLHSELTQSESSPLFLLLFSDVKIVLINFKYFVLAVLESAPIIPIFETLAALALMMLSLRFIVKYYEQIFKLIKSINAKKI